jgi:hypothetical protein
MIGEERLLTGSRERLFLFADLFLELVVHRREQERHRDPVDDLQTQRYSQRRERPAVLVVRNHRGIAVAEQSSYLLLSEAHPPSVQNEVILFLFG